MVARSKSCDGIRVSDGVRADSGFLVPGEANRVAAYVRAGGVTALIVTLATVASVAAQQASALRVDDPRPLAAMVRMLEQRHGWIVTYEDPPYLFAGDWQDVTGAVRRDGKFENRVLIPAGGPFTFEYAGRGASDSAAMLTALLSAYHASGYPGEFRLVRTEREGVFHIRPARSRTADGTLSRRQSLLEVDVQFAGENRNGLAALQDILAFVGKARKVRLILGTVPVRLLAQATISPPRRSEQAAEAILRILEATGHTLSWQLFCDPGVSGVCALNIHQVQ